MHMAPVDFSIGPHAQGLHADGSTGLFQAQQNAHFVLLDWCIYALILCDK